MSTPSSQDLYRQLQQQELSVASNPNKFDELTAATTRKQQELNQQGDRKAQALQALDDSYAKRNSLSGQIMGLGVDSDLAREFLGGAASGTGSVVKGAGELASIFGLGEGESTDKVNQWFQSISQFADDSQNLAFRNDMLRSTPEGDLFDPSTWSVDDVNLNGILGHLAQMGGQFTPQLLAAYVTRGASLASGLATTGAVGGLQAGGGAADGQEQMVAAMSEGDLFQSSGLYRDLREQGKSHEQAKEETKQAAGKAGFLGAAPVGALGGAATNYILRPATNLLAKTGTGRALNKVGVSALEEGTQEVAEGVAARAASNAAIDSDQNLTEGTLTDFALGAGFGAGLGGASLGLSGAQKGAEKLDGAVQRAQKADADTVATKKLYDEAKATKDPEKIVQLIGRNRDQAANLAAEMYIAEDASEQDKTISQNVMNAVADEYQTILDRAREDQNDEAIQQTEEKLRQIINLQNEMRALQVDPEAKTKNATQRLKEAANDVDNSSEAIDRFIVHAMNHSEAVTSEQFERALRSKHITKDQENFVRDFSAAQQELLRAKNTTSVSRDISVGSTGFKGLVHYNSAVSTALARGNINGAIKELSDLKRFGRAKASKADVVNQMIESNQTGQVIFDPKSGLWKRNEGQTISDTDLRAQGGLTIHSGSQKLATALSEEASLISGNYKRLKAKLDYARNGVEKIGGSPRTSPLQDATSKDKSPVVREGNRDTKQQEINDVARIDGHFSTNPEVESTVSTNEQSGFSDDSQSKIESKREERTKNSAERNTFVAFFTQKKTNNPFVKNANELSFSDRNFLPSEYQELGDREGAALDHMIETISNEEGFIADLKSIIGTKRKEYRFQDPIQFFRDENGDLPEGLLAAISIAAYQYVSENAGFSGYKTQDQVNRILGRDTQTPIMGDEKILQTAGDMPNIVRDSIGQRVMALAGIKADKDAPLNEAERMATGLGMYGLALLRKRGIMEAHKVPGSAFAQAEGELAGGNPRTMVRFKRVNNEPSNDLLAEAQEIIDVTRQTGSVLTKAFKVERDNPMPSDSPIPFKQTKAQRSRSEISSKQKKILEKEQAKPNSLRRDMVQLWKALDDNNLLEAFAGVKSTDNIHVDAKKSVEAKNNGLRLEIERFKEFLSSKEDIDAPFYFPRVVWSNFRVGIKSSINPQTSKIHRHLIKMDGWETSIKLSDVDAVNQFNLAVADGLGIKTDKQKNDASLKQFNEKINEPVYSNTVNVLKKVHTGEVLSSTDIETLQALPDKSFHLLEGLTAYAGYRLALESGQKTYKTSLMREVDGINNGPILTLMQLGFKPLQSSFRELLHKGGMFQESDPFKHFTEYKSQGNDDLYEGLLTSIERKFQTVMEADPVMRTQLTAYNALAGEFDTETNEITPPGRNSVKTPLTAFMFGSSPKKAVQGMARDLIGHYQSKIQEAVETNDPRLAKVAIRAVNRFLEMADYKDRLDENMTPQQALEGSLGTGIEKAIRQGFYKGVGAQITEVLKTEFAEYIESRNAMNRAANMAYGIYNAVYQRTREDYIDRLKDENDIETNGNNRALRDLTAQEEAEIQSLLKPMEPILNTAFSKDSKERTAGFSLLKLAKSRSDSGLYKTSAEMKIELDGSNKLSGTANETGFTDIGVGGVIGGIHSTDSYISSVAYENGAALNVHDAHGLGVGDVLSGAERLNKATWDAMLQYSFPIEMANMLVKTIQGYTTYLTNERARIETLEGSEKADAQKKLKALEKRVAELGKFRGQSAKEQVAMINYVAKSATKTKLEAMKEMAVIDQYGMEGGSYQVTEQDRAEAEEALSKIAVNPITEPQQEVDAAVEENWGLLGTPKIAADLELANFLKNNSNIQAKKVLPVLRARIKQTQKGRLRNANLMLLEQVNRLLNDDVAIRYITPKQAPVDFGESNSEMVRNAQGFTVRTSQEGKPTIWVKSPDFASSGLTPELLLHELVHATIDQAIDRNDKYVRPLVKELDTLRQEVKKVIDSDSQYSDLKNAVADTKEFVAWGMTNSRIQEILENIEFTTQTGSRTAVSMMKKFIDTLTRILMPGKSSDLTNTGLYALVSNVSGLYEAESFRIREQQKRIADAQATAESREDVVLQAQEYVSKPMHFTSEQVLEALAAGDQTSDSQLNRLKNVLNQTVNTVNGSYGAFALFANEHATTTMADTYLNSLLGNKPYVSKLLGVLNLSHAETYVIQQLEMTLNSAFSNNYASYKELNRIYNYAKSTLKNDATLDQDTYEFLFNSSDSPKDYLSRFAAAAMVYEPLARKLEGIATPTRFADVTSSNIGSWLQKVIFRVLAALSNVMPKTFGELTANKRLRSLVFQMANNEARNKDLLIKQRAQRPTVMEAWTTAASDKLRKAVADAGQSSVVQKAPFAAVRAIGAVGAAVASDRGNLVIEHLQNAYNGVSKGRNGFFAEMVNEIRGARQPLMQFYEMLRGANGFQRQRKQIIDQVKKTVLTGFENPEELTDQTLEAITKVFIRADMYSLVQDKNYPMELIEVLLKDSTRLDQEIQNLKGQLKGQFRHYYDNQANSLGYHLATGRVGGANLQLNAHNIAYMVNTKHYSNTKRSDLEKNREIIDKLTSLYALSYIDQSTKTRATEVLERENRRGNGENGVEAAIRIHGSLQQDAKAKLFNGNPLNFIKGYIKETSDPHREVILVREDQWQDAEDRGYVEATGVLPKTKGDLNPKGYKLFYTNMGMEPRTTGIMSYTGKRRRGTDLQTSDDFNANGFESDVVENNRSISRAYAVEVSEMMKPGRFDPKANSDRATYVVPSIDGQGKAKEYRYLMNDKTKRLLNQDNSIGQVLGAMAGHAFDKVNTEQMNAEAVQALYDQYQEDGLVRPDSYVEVSLNAADPQINETYALLPDHTKQEIKKVWGDNKMYVHKDVYNILFGYRRYSITEAFDKAREHRNIMEAIITWLPEFLFGKKAAKIMKQTGDVWQELVLMVKDIVVIKNLFTLLGNIASNVSLLLLRGVNPTKIYRDHVKAIQGVVAYQRDSNELVRLETTLNSGFLGNRDEQELRNQIDELKNAIDNNPVKELIDANMFQTIVEDVDASDDQYSYQSKFAEWASEKTAFLPDGVKTIGKHIFMTHDTPLYQILNQSTAMSDFVARYTLFEHLTSRKNNRLTREAAIAEIADAFVQYDVPSHRGMEYMNNMGLLFFTKYFLRIQKVILNAMQENPARALLMVMLNHFYSWLPVITDSGFFERFGTSPFDVGALKAPDVVDEILPINVLGSVFN